MYSLGIDVGSTTIKVVVLEEELEIKYSIVDYINADVLLILEKLIEKVAHFPISSIGVTGSARTLIGKCLKADKVVSEVIAHAIGGERINKNNIDVIIEIGGQDSKVIFFENNLISDFKMNSVCGAGTGSFIETQVRRLGISLEEFGKIALESDNNIYLNGKCGIFIESAVVNLQRNGESKANIASAICHALVRNYLDEFNKNKRIRGRVVFQGRVAKIPAIRKYFEVELGCPVIVNENCDLMGAIGVAILARESVKNKESKKVKMMGNVQQYRKNSYMCNGCGRNCIVTKFESLEDSFVIGGRCGRYE